MRWLHFFVLPSRCIFVPDNLTHVVFAPGVDARGKGIEHLNSTNLAQYIGQCLYALRYHDLLGAPAELIIQLSNLRSA
jgi:hypothetical protein